MHYGLSLLCGFECCEGSFMGAVFRAEGRKKELVFPDWRISPGFLEDSYSVVFRILNAYVSDGIEKV